MMNADAIKRRLSRRRFGMLALGTIGGGIASRHGSVRGAEQIAPTAVATGICGVEPGIKLLLDWREGKPVVTVSEMVLPLDWVPYQHPSLVFAMRIPPDWTAYSGWADSFSESGMPIWQERPPAIPQLSAARFVSPGQDAAFEFGVGNIQGQPLSPAQASSVAEQSLLGERPKLREICSYEDAYDPLAPNWFHADYAETGILITSGVAIGMPSTVFPGTTVTYQTLFGPKDRFEETMRTTFIPMLGQTLGGGGEGDGDDGDGGNGGDGDGDGGDGGDGDE